MERVKDGKSAEPWDGMGVGQQIDIDMGAFGKKRISACVRMAIAWMDLGAWAMARHSMAWRRRRQIGSDGMIARRYLVRYLAWQLEKEVEKRRIEEPGRG